MLAPMANQVPVTLVVGEEEFLVDRAVREALARPAPRSRRPQAAVTAAETCTTWRRPRSRRGAGLADLAEPVRRRGDRDRQERAARRQGDRRRPDQVRRQPGARTRRVIVTHAGGAKGKALVTDLAKAGARQVDCPKLTRASERTDFVRAEFRRVGRQADADAVRALLDAIGG